jgi:FkbM family methyltransferase
MKWIIKQNYDDNDFLPWVDTLLDYVKKSYPDPHTWIDIGAHTGEVTKLMAKHSTDYDSIHAFEPDYSQYKKLCKTFKPKTNIVIWPLAVNNNITTTDFFVPLFGLVDGGGFLKISPMGFRKRFCAKRSVTTIALDSLNWPTTPRINFIKIDTETNDFLIMQGGQNLINKHRPIILFEFSGCLAGDAHNYNFTEWYEFFQKNNYHLRVPFGGHEDSYVLARYNQFAPEMYNLLAVPNETPIPF